MTVPPWLLPEDEPGKWIAAVQAAAVYALGLLLLTISVSFQSAAAPPSVEYISLIPTPQVEVAPPPEPEPEPESKPEPKLAEVKKPQAPKPDIALAEKKKKEEQARKKREAEKKKKREQELKKKREDEARKKREEDERRKREQQEREEEKAREEKAKAERLAAANAEARAKYASILARRSAGYIDDIRGAIKGKHSRPLSVPKDPCIEVVVVFKLKPYGKGGRADVVDIPVVVEPSGYPEYDDSVVHAILHASPLVFPKEPELMEDFSEIRFEMAAGEGVC